MIRATRKEYRSAVDEYMTQVIREFNDSGNICINPSCSNMRELLKKWYQETDAEVNMYPDEKVRKTYYNAIYNSLRRLLNKEAGMSIKAFRVDEREGE